ncbi:MAG: hypothetical protein ACK443_01885 [Methylococcaceae bacterium]|jgi:hypothetical protein
MSEDLAFRIQLGVILPMLKEKLSADISVIVEEVVKIVKAGNREGDVFEMEPVKEMIMKDIDIFLTDCILPDIEKKYAPPPAVDVAEEPAEAE